MVKIFGGEEVLPVAVRPGDGDWLGGGQAGLDIEKFLGGGGGGARAVEIVYVDLKDSWLFVGYYWTEDF